MPNKEIEMLSLRGKLETFSVLILATGFVLTPTAAQVTTGNIRGTVVDTSEGGIGSVTVTLTNVQMGTQRVVTTNGIGDFNAPSMPLGDYQISAEIAGFQKKIVSGLNLQVDQTAVIRIVLDPGAVTQQVEVTSAAPLLDAQTSSLGQVIENKRIVELPLNGRNPFALGLLVGGVTPFSGLVTNLPFVAGGGRASSNDILLDGVDDTIRFFAGAGGRNGVNYIPSVDAVEEFKVKTSNFSAEYGRSAGYTVNTTIKSGTNTYHGSLFEFLRNDDLDANNFVSNYAGVPIAKFRQNQFGGTIGGPVRFPRYNGHDRTFFFFDYQGTELRQADASSLLDVAPASWRQGNFSSSSTQIYDPASRLLGPTGVVTSDPFPGNIIPQSRINPTVLKYQSLIPLANVGGVESSSRNYLAISPSQMTRKQGDARVDHKLFKGNNLMTRFSFAQQSTPSQGSFIYSPTNTLFNTRNFVVSDTHLFSPTVLNDFRFGFNRANSSVEALKLAEGSAFAAQNGLQFGPVTGFPSVNWTSSGATFGSSDFSGFGSSGSNLIFENAFQWTDSVTVIRGHHTLKMGGEARRFQFNNLPGYPLSAGYFFGPVFSANPSVAKQTGLSYADFILGFPTNVTGSSQNQYSNMRDLYAGAYIQDDWKITPRLTLNLGLRYDLYTQPVDARNIGGVFNPYAMSDLGRLGVWELPGQNGNSNAIIKGHHLNIGPRFGFAYNPTPKFVVRGGYGIFFSQREQNRETTIIANTLLNFNTITSPQVISQTSVTPPMTFSGGAPLSVQSGLPADFAGYDAKNPLAVGSNLLSSSISDSKFPMLQQFNLSLQYEFAGGLLVEAAYAGARGLHWVQRVNIGMIPFSDALAGKTTQADRPLNYVNGSPREDFAIVNNWYHSVNLRVERRFSKGLTFLANYTISKNVNSGGSGNSQYTQEGDTAAIDSYNLKLERGLSPLDIPQKFVVSALYELPFGSGKAMLAGSGIGNLLFGGWKANGILVLRSGFPEDLRYPVNPPTFTSLNRPDRVLGQPMLVANPGFDQYFNPKAFQAPPQVPDYRGNLIQGYGNAGRLILRGPGSRNLDFSLFKEFATSEKTKLQFRAEAFNLTNTPSFTLPVATSAALQWGNKAFGKLTGSQTVGRQVQFGLKFLF
jgi:outer membrane receptor protein involved in Fe transport